MDLFNDQGATFSDCRKYRYVLWRIWDRQKPNILFLGLNPSIANETKPDQTIRSVIRIANSNTYGGIFMMNCFPYVSTDPKLLCDFGNTHINDVWLKEISVKCKDVVFAWGNFDVVREHGRDQELMTLFPKALCLGKNSNGSPKHPLFLSGKTILQSFF